MNALDELAHLLRPAGGGLYLVSTGRAEQLALQRRIYGAATDEEVDTKFRASLERVQNARIAILGIPSDVGAGFLRGANLGPQMIRTTMLAEDDTFAARMESEGIVDANIEALETLGATGWSALQARCRAKAEQAIDQGT